MQTMLRIFYIVILSYRSTRLLKRMITWHKSPITMWSNFILEVIYRSLTIPTISFIYFKYHILVSVSFKDALPGLS